MTPQPEEAWKKYVKGISLNIEQRKEPFWSSDKHWFQQGFAAGERAAYERAAKVCEAERERNTHLYNMAVEDREDTETLEHFSDLSDQSEELRDQILALAQDGKREGRRD